MGGYSGGDTLRRKERLIIGSAQGQGSGWARDRGMAVC